MPTAEALVAGRHIQQDGKRRHVVGLNVAVDQKPLAVIGNVVGEDVGGGNGARPWTWKRVAGVPVTKVLSAGCPRFAPALWVLTWANDAAYSPHR